MSFQINFGSRGFRRFGLFQVSCMLFFFYILKQVSIIFRRLRERCEMFCGLQNVNLTFFFPFWVNSSFKSGIKQEWSGGNMSWYLTLVVNCTPVLMMRGFCGCVGMHGCFSTTNELRNKPHLQWFTQFCSSHHFLHLEGLWFCLFSDSFQYGVTCC